MVGGNHTETVSPYPLSQYGDFKRNCEEMLLWSLGNKCLVARLPRIISKDTVENTVRHIESGNGFYSNLFFNCNTPQNLADAILYSIKENKSGVLHLVSHDFLSDADLARKIITAVGLEIDIPVLELNPQSYCTLLGCSDLSKLHQSNDGGFYLTMVCTDEVIAARFRISCAEGE